MPSRDTSTIPTTSLASRERRRGLVWGFIGVASFSLTLPATRVAVAGLDSVFVGLGRAVVAAALAAIVLIATRSSWPGWRLLPRLAIVAAGVIVGFPLFSALAMRYVPASHGAVVIGLRWQVISWALVIAAPFVLVPTVLVADARLVTASAAAWAGFAYVSVVSMFLGFFAWYRGLALGGIAAVGQVQLLQPFLTIFAAALLLGEQIDPATFVAAAMVIAAITFGRRSI